MQILNLFLHIFLAFKDPNILDVADELFWLHSQKFTLNCDLWQ